MSSQEGPSTASTPAADAAAAPPTKLNSRDVAAMLESPLVAREVIMKLSPTKRRELLVAASYYEWFGEEIKEGSPAPKDDELDADYAAHCGTVVGSSTSLNHPSSPDNSASLDIKANDCQKVGSSEGPKSATIIKDSNDAVNFSWEEFLRRRKERKEREERYRMRREMQEAHPIPSYPLTKDAYTEWIRGTVQTVKDPSSMLLQKRSREIVPFKVLLKVAIQTGLPFMAFGTLDNSMLILAGDMLDNLVGADLNLSAMGAAALGGIVSGVVGIQIHGLAERAVTKYGPPPPALKPSQWRSERVQSAIHWGGTLGLVCGLLCGMFPLLLISDSSSVRRAIEDDGEAPEALKSKH